jgi:hypothetical protein
MWGGGSWQSLEEEAMSDERQSVQALLVELGLPCTYAQEMESKGVLWCTDLAFIDGEDELLRICPSMTGVDMHTMKLMKSIQMCSGGRPSLAPASAANNRAKFDDSVVTAGSYPGCSKMGLVWPLQIFVMAIHKQGTAPGCYPHGGVTIGCVGMIPLGLDHVYFFFVGWTCGLPIAGMEE